MALVATTVSIFVVLPFAVAVDDFVGVVFVAIVAFAIVIFADIA